MDGEVKKVIQLENGHVLFIGIVGYSKFLIEKRKERVGRLAEIVLGLRRSPSRSMSNSLGLQPAMEWRWVSSMARRNL